MKPQNLMDIVNNRCKEASETYDKKDYIKARVCLYRAAQNGNSESFNLLKNLLFRSYLTKCLNDVKNSGNAEDIVALGFLYYFEIIVEQDKVEALRLFYLAEKINPSMENTSLTLITYESNPDNDQQYIALYTLMRAIGEELG